MRSLPLAIALGLLAACSSSPSTTTTEEQDSQSFLAAKDKTLLAYRTRGSGDEVLLLPGGSWMLEDLEPLTERYRVISYDMRGRGRSDVVPANRPPTLEQDLGDLETVVEWFSLERFSILAIDYQAAVAAHYAARHPEKIERLVIASPMPIRKDPYSAIYDRVFADRLDSKDFEELREMSVMLVYRRDPPRWAAAYKKAVFKGWVADPKSLQRMKSTPFVEPNIEPERAIRLYEAVRRNLGPWDFRDELKQIQAPALIVYGSQDPVPERSNLEWASTLPNGKAERVEDSGRLPWIEQPKRFFAAVEGFLGGDA